MDNENKERKITIIVIIAVLAVVTIVVVAFSVYQNKKAEQSILNAMKQGKPIEETLQESLTDFQGTADEITDEVEQKMEELK